MYMYIWTLLIYVYISVIASNIIPLPLAPSTDQPSQFWMYVSAAT